MKTGSRSPGNPAHFRNPRPSHPKFSHFKKSGYSPKNLFPKSVLLEVDFKHPFGNRDRGRSVDFFSHKFKGSFYAFAGICGNGDIARGTLVCRGILLTQSCPSDVSGRVGNICKTQIISTCAIVSRQSDHKSFTRVVCALKAQDICPSCRNFSPRNGVKILRGSNGTHPCDICRKLLAATGNILTVIIGACHKCHKNPSRAGFHKI